MTIKCAFCGNIIDDEDFFCMHCGKPVVENRCDNCEIGLPENAKFCPQCGEESSFSRNGLLHHE